jgi:hypothetical protein
MTIPKTPISAPSSKLLETLFGLILPENRQPHFSDLVAGGYIPFDKQNMWVEALQQPECAPMLIGYQLAEFKARLDNLIHNQSIGPVAKTRYPDVIRRIQEALRNSAFPGLEYEWIRQKTIIDFGSGTYNPLALAIIFFANGFERVTAVERFPVHVEIAYSGALEIAKCLLANPAELNFSGIDTEVLKQRVASLSFDTLRENLARLNQGEISSLSLGPIDFVKALDDSPTFRFDLLISNSVLEHVMTMDTEIPLHRHLIAPDGVCVHTVDFSDHRAIGRNGNVFGMYYDGDLHDINGLRPSEVLTVFSKSHFLVTSSGDLNIGTEYIDRNRIIDRYRQYGNDDLTTWVRTYLLRPS